MNEYVLAVLALLLGILLTVMVMKVPGMEFSVSSTVVQWIVKETLYIVFSGLGLLFLAGWRFNLVQALRATPENLIGLAILAGFWLHGFATVLGR
ncbi:MAG: hypothetical protein ACM31P_02230 [Actinomycetota bacterium]